MALDIDSLVAHGILDRNEANSSKWIGLEMWTGTQEEFDALETLYDNYLYFVISPDQEPLLDTAGNVRTITQAATIEASGVFNGDGASVPGGVVIDDPIDPNTPAVPAFAFPEITQLPNFSITGAPRIIQSYNPVADMFKLNNPNSYLAYYPRRISIACNYKLDGTFDIFSWQFANGKDGSTGKRLDEILYSGRWLDREVLPNEYFYTSIEVLELNGVPVDVVSNEGRLATSDTNPQLTNIEGVDVIVSGAPYSNGATYSVGTNKSNADTTWQVQFMEHNTNKGTPIWYAHTMHLDPNVALASTAKVRLLVQGINIETPGELIFDVDVNIQGGPISTIADYTPLVVIETDVNKLSDPETNFFAFWVLKPAVMLPGSNLDQTLSVYPYQEVTFTKTLSSDTSPVTLTFNANYWELPRVGNGQYVLNRGESITMRVNWWVQPNADISVAASAIIGGVPMTRKIKITVPIYTQR